ncbi:MAG TPA: hypothetical protein VGF59_04370 [Bryobacteraceae bacterium]
MAVNQVKEAGMQESGGAFPSPVPAAARQKWMLTQDALDGLLAALGPDRDTAADRYLEIRRNLVRLFEWRGCSTPDEYADEAINRCARKIGEGEEVRDVATYCIGVARMLVLEMNRERARAPRPLEDAPEPRAAPAESDPEGERRLECLRRCLGQLSPENRDLILQYYEGDKGAKIKRRKGLRDVFGIPPSTLRMRALRVREKLQLCSESCLQCRGAGLL